MEATYRKPHATVKVSERIKVKDFISDWCPHMESDLDSGKGTNEIDRMKRAMNIPDDTFDELSTVCSPETLVTQISQDLRNKQRLYQTFPAEVDLAAVRAQKADVERRETHHEYHKARIRRMKYRCKDELLWKERGGEIPRENRVEPNTAVLTVRVYQPYTAVLKKKSKLIVDHIYMVLSCQTLTDLRDKIRCVSDLMVEGDFSENPDLPSDVCAKEIYKSGFFFIENKFYNDMRDPDCRDYSKIIMDWTTSKPRGMGPYQSTSMENVKFEHLSISLGQPYLYMHQGNCEHLLVFSDIRMFHPDDVQDIREYPLMTVRSTKKRTVCKVCCASASRWVTLNDELAPENPSYFCDPCFRSLHYDEHGMKVCQFEAYKYFDSHVVS